MTLINFVSNNFKILLCNHENHNLEKKKDGKIETIGNKVVEISWTG